MFCIEKESREPEYQFNGKMRSKVPLGILIFISLFVLNGTVSPKSEEIAKGGEIAYHPVLITSAMDAFDHISAYAKEGWNLDLVKDYPLTITGNGKTITFIADGYDISNKVVYEWVGNPEYQTNFSDEVHLSPKEISTIKDSKFGDYYIAIIKGVDTFTVEYELRVMMNYFKINSKK